MFELKWANEKAITGQYDITVTMLRNVKEKIKEEVWNEIEKLVIEMRPLCAAIENLSSDSLRLSDVVYHWNGVYVQLEEALNASHLHVTDGCNDEVYSFYEDELNKKVRQHIEYDLGDPNAQCAVNYQATVHGVTKSWCMYFAYNVDGRFRSGSNLIASDLKKAELYLKCHFHNDQHIAQILCYYDQCIVKRELFNGSEWDVSMDGDPVVQWLKLKRGLENSEENDGALFKFVGHVVVVLDTPASGVSV